MKRLDVKNYSHKQIKKMLLGNRKIAFRYEILDKNEKAIGECTATGNIDFNSESIIMRIANFNIKELKDINYIDERIKPYMRLWTPSGWVDYPLGVFLISSPSRVCNGFSVSRECECYDKTVILTEDKFAQRYIVRKGSNYVNAIISIIQSAGIYNVEIDKTDKLLNTDIEFAIGTTKLEAINQLLKSVNYNPLYFDELGTARASEYVIFSARTIEEEYKTDKNSIIKSGSEEILDIFNCPNKIVRYLENPEVGELISSYTNIDPNSKLSTVSRGRTILDVASVSDIADKTTLDAYVRRIASEKQVYQTIKFTTALMPHHSYYDCLLVENKELNTNSKYVETAWSMNLEVGGNMNHICKRVVEM